MAIIIIIISSKCSPACGHDATGTYHVLFGAACGSDMIATEKKEANNRKKKQLNQYQYRMPFIVPSATLPMTMVIIIIFQVHTYGFCRFFNFFYCWAAFFCHYQEMSMTRLQQKIFQERRETSAQRFICVIIIIYILYILYIYNHISYAIRHFNFLDVFPIGSLSINSESQLPTWRSVNGNIDTQTHTHIYNTYDLSSITTLYMCSITCLNLQCVCECISFYFSSLRTVLIKQ